MGSVSQKQPFTAPGTGGNKLKNQSFQKNVSILLMFEMSYKQLDCLLSFVQQKNQTVQEVYKRKQQCPAKFNLIAETRNKKK